VGLVLEPVGVATHFNFQVYRGLRRAVRALGVGGRALTPAPREGYGPSLSQLAREGYDLVIATGTASATALDRVAGAFPRRRFAIVDVPNEALGGRPDNVQGLVFREHEAGYLAGFLAALVAGLARDEPVISSVGGERTPSVERFAAGYQAGARRASPEITILHDYTGDFVDPVKGRAVALAQIARGSQVVFQVASACGLGAIAAAGERGVWAIGVDVDQSDLGAHVLTSAVKRLDLAVWEAIRGLCEGRPASGTRVFSLSDGAVGLGPVSPAVPERLRLRLDHLSAEVASGGVAIPTSLS